MPEGDLVGTWPLASQTGRLYIILLGSGCRLVFVTVAFSTSSTGRLCGLTQGSAVSVAKCLREPKQSPTGLRETIQYLSLSPAYD